MSRIYLLISFGIGLLLAGVAGAETFKLATGETLTGEVLAGSGNDLGIQLKLGEGKYERIPWTSFSQEELKKFAQNPKLEPFVEPLIEITTEERIKKTEVDVKQPPRLERPPSTSLIGAFFGSGLGLFILLCLYAANIYAGYEVAIFRAQSVPLVCGVAAIAPLVGPIVFLSLKTRIVRAEEPLPEGAEGAEGAAPTGEAATAAADAVNPMQATGVEHPAGLKIAHAEAEPKTNLPPPTVFQRGQFTFNRRFFETKFANFFGLARREEDRHMVLQIKSARGEYITQRITRIAANDVHIQVQHGQASEEVMVPFQEIQEIRLKHRDA